MNLIIIDNLKTIRTISGEYGYSITYIHKLINKGVLKCVIIDGFKFIDITTIPDDLKKRKEQI